MAIPPPTGAPTRLAAATAAEPAVAGPACHCERSAAISSRPDFCINFPSNPRPPGGGPRRERAGNPISPRATGIVAGLS